MTRTSNRVGGPSNYAQTTFTAIWFQVMSAKSANVAERTPKLFSLAETIALLSKAAHHHAGHHPKAIRASSEQLRRWVDEGLPRPPPNCPYYLRGARIYVTPGKMMFRQELP